MRHGRFAFVLGTVLAFASAQSIAAPVLIVTQSLPETRGDPFSYNGLPAGLISQAVFDPLVSIDQNGQPVPGLALTWTQEEPLRWVFTLRPHVTFSDGEPFDAAAVISAFEYLLGTPIPADALTAQVIRDKVGRVVARDSLTVVLETKVVDPILPVHLFALRIPAPQAWAKNMDGFAESPVGTGPFKVSRWTAGAVELQENSTSWRRPKVPAITIRAIPDQGARALALTSGTADIAMDLAADAQIDSIHRLVPRTSTMVMFVQFVTVADSPLKDVRVRQALNYAVDKKRLIEAFLNDAVPPATQFTHDNAFGFNAALSAYPYDPEKAKALLAEAGYGKGFALPTVFVGGAGAEAAIYQQIAADLTAVNVRMELRQTTLTTWMGYLFSGDWPSLAFVTGVQGYDPVLAFNTRSCDWAKPHHCDPDLMPLLRAAREAKTPDALKQRTAALMAYERDNPPGLLLWRKASFDGIGPRITSYSAAQDRVSFDTITAAP